MKKIIKFLYIFVIGAMFLASCEPNEIPTFQDKDSFVGFTKPSISVSENAGVVKLPVTFGSPVGKSITATYTVKDGTAKQGTNYSLKNAAATVTFDAQTMNTFIELNIINLAGKFTGDIKFTVTISDVPGANVGGDNVCTVTINDLDHPLTPILGNFNATGTSYFDGATSWAVTLAKDASDVSKVWITGLVSGTTNPVYGVVNSTMTEIKVPVGQEILKHSSYGFIELKGFFGPDGATDIPDGGNITIKINGDFSMDVMDEIGAYVWQNADKSGGLGWWDIFQADVKLKR